MKTIRSWDEMSCYGIVPLTTEADGLKYRIVCDVTAKGKELVERTLGIVGLDLERNWDYGTNDEPHVGCIMLGPEILTMIGIYALLDDDCHEVWITRSCELFGIQSGDPQCIIDDLQIRYGNELAHRVVYPEVVGYWSPWSSY